MNIITQLGLGAMIILGVTYVIYMCGLSLVLRQLDVPPWKAFVPGYNILAQIEGTGLPRNWFVKAIIPYVGALYALAIAIRLGKIYGRRASFSSVWLTFGAMVGMWVIALGPNKPDMGIVKSPPPRIDTAKVDARMQKLKHFFGKRS